MLLSIVALLLPKLVKANMGLGMTRDGKKMVCGSATSYQDSVESVTAIVIDINAMFRKECVYTTSDVSPRTAVSIFFKRY